MRSSKPAAKVERVSDARELQRVVDLTAKVFSSYFDGVTHWRQALDLDPGYKPGQNFVVYAEGRPVANVRVTTRIVRIGAATTALGGIGDVACDPAYRGRHYPTACLKEALRFMEESGHTLSLLGTGIHDFYRRLGWEVAAPHYSLSVARSSGGKLPRGWSLKAFACGRLPEVMRLYERENARRTLSVVRDRDYWEKQIAFSLMPPARGPFDFVKENGRGFSVLYDERKKARAYMRSKVEGDRFALLEAAAPDRQAAAAVLSLAAGRAPEGGRVGCSLPPDSLLAQVAIHDFKGEASARGGGEMVRIVNLKRLFRDMEPAFTERLAGARCAPAAIWIETDSGGGAGVQWDGATARAADRRPAGSLRVCIPQSRLVGLITGYRGANEVVEKAPARAAALLDAMFPRGWAHMWPLDRF